jgi:nucleolar protein 58
MYVLFETPAGFALFKVLKEGKLKDLDSLHENFSTPEKAAKIVKLKAFKRFADTKQAMKSVQKLVNGKVSKTLDKFLTKHIVQAEIEDVLAVADKKLGKEIQEKLGITCKTGEKANELIRCLRFQMNSLLEGLEEKEIRNMSLGLAHSMSRYKLQFSTDKVDTMVIQAVSLLEDLDKELNNYAMRLREWYGWHFPELGKIVTDNIVYAKAVSKIGMRKNVKNISNEDLEEVVGDEDIAQEVKEAAEVSMGTEILDEDEKHIRTLCNQVIEISDYRANLAEYLKNRMTTIAPNLTLLVGELVAAKLISHAGSLINLAKLPASTVQILGAEKALFRALKTKKNTPKYGLIYNASIVGQAGSKLKGKISRTLANKCSLCTRYDALGEENEGTLGVKSKSYIEGRLKLLETGGSVIKGQTGGGPKKYDANKQTSGGFNQGNDFYQNKRQAF